jgi:hypothetical protein
MSSIISTEVERKFDAMKREVALLQIHRNIYRQLFEHSHARADILDRCGREVFICLQISLETEMIMLLSRITDTPGEKDKERLSFQQFHSSIARNDHQLGKKLKDAIRKISKKREEIREYRNKRLAHLDLKTMLEGPSPDPVTLRMIDEAITDLHEYMRTFEQHYEPEAGFIYDTSFLVKSAGDVLVSILENGLRFEELMERNQLENLSNSSTRHDSLKGHGKLPLNRIESGRYSALIRGDYLRELGIVRGDRERDRCIQEAIEYFLGLPPEERRRATTAQRVRITFPEGFEPDYHMWLEIVSIPDELAEKLANSMAYVDSTKTLNAAIRLWLEKKEGVEGFKP